MSTVVHKLELPGGMRADGEIAKIYRSIGRRASIDADSLVDGGRMYANTRLLRH